jgi:DNA mismatch repair protein MSH5
LSGLVILAPANDAAAENFGLPYILEVRPPNDFHTEAAKTKLIGLNIAADVGPRIDFTTPGDVLGADMDDGPEHALGSNGQLLKIAGFVDLENSAGVSVITWIKS